MSNEHTNAYKLFNYPFACAVPALYLTSDVELEEFGSYSNGSVEDDQAAALEPIRTIITIAKMAEIHKENGSFRILVPKDSIRIYDIIVGHLKDWLQTSRTQVNNRKVPMEDLKLLDSLATEIYRTARVLIVTDTTTSTLMQKLQGISPFTAPKIANNAVAEHDPITKHLTADYVRRERRWN